MDLTVYTNCDQLTLVVNGAEVETKEAVDHCIVFENVALKDGENTVTAMCGCCCGVEDTITLNGVAEHNSEYTLPDIAEAMAGATGLTKFPTMRIPMRSSLSKVISPSATPSVSC